jgi:ATP-binding cassette subfamily B protein
MLAKFSKGRYHLLAYRLFKNYIGRSYKNFISQNSSNLSKTIINEAQNLSDILSALLFMLSEIFIIIFIYSMMLYINWKITLLLSLILFFNALLLVKTVSKKIKQEGTNKEKFQKVFYEVLNSTFGNFKMLKLKSDDDKILEKFSQASSGYAKSNITNETLGQFPRLFLEALGFIIVVFIVIYLIYKYQTDISGAMALISVFILGLYRLMPSANRILTSYNQIMFNYKALDIIHDDLIYEIENLGDEKIDFNNFIKLDSISFSYIKNKKVLQDISLNIRRGEKIAFIGESGSGKSTLADIIMGLYKPESGSIYVDETVLSSKNIKDWRKKIGYIPQNIYLFDGSVAENIAFDTDFDLQKVKKVLMQASLYDFLEKNHDGLDTKVGENGLKLSGGQKQRVAIARALYSNPDILILDEATSALDNETESKIMDEIYKIAEDKTLIIIAHRLSTISACDKIYTLKEGVIKSV